MTGEKIDNFFDKHLVAFLVGTLIIALAIGIADILLHKYEFETSNGEIYEANYCTVGTDSVPYCIINDIKIFDIKSFRKVMR